MIDKPLAGLEVVNTRPQHQADYLSSQLSRLGARVLLFPLIHIDFKQHEPLPDELSCCRHIIFTSRNAVEAARNLWPEFFRKLSALNIFAIGDATLSALNSHGVDQVKTMPGSSSSEQLLQHPDLAEDNISASPVLIVKGEGGRKHLFDELKNRGAKPFNANLYCRQKPCYDQSEIDALFRHMTDSRIIVLTSVEAMNNLMDYASEQYQSALLQCQLLVLSERLAERAKQCGFEKEILIAQQTGDDGLVKVLLNKFDEEFS